MNIVQTEAIILTARDWGDADRIITLLSPELGKTKAVAYGARQIRSRLSGAIQPFSHVGIHLAAGKNIDSVRQCQIIDSFPAIKQDLALMAYSSFIAELSVELLPESEPQPQAFCLVLNTLQTLTKRNPRITIQAFAWQLLSLTGYQPEYINCVTCGQQIIFPAHFDSSAGGAICNECGKLSDVCYDQDTCSLLARFLTLDMAAPDKFLVSGAALTQLEKILHSFLLVVLEKPLKSLSFIQTVTKND